MTISDGLEAKIERDDAGTTVVLRGAIRDTAAPVLEAAFSELIGKVRINFRGITSINSYGIGLLMKHLSRISRAHSVEFVECSETLVDQFQMLEFSLYGRIRSFFVRYLCRECGRERNVLLDVDKDFGPPGEVRADHPPVLPCACGGTSRVDEALDFLEEHLT